MIRDTRAEVVVVWTTLPEDMDPVPLARTLVEERLAACVSAQAGLRSLYRWQGSVEDATEQQVTIKTTSDCVDRLERRLTELHPYDVPEFLVLRTSDGSRSYVDWVRESTTSPRSIET